VRSHAKASSEGSNAGGGNGRGLLRRAFAARGASSEAKGSGARPAQLLGLAALLVSLATALLGAAPASAFDAYVNEGRFDQSAFSDPTKIAVDDATGNVLVVDAGHSHVQVWSPGGVASTHLIDFGAGQLSSPYGIAIDQSNGEVYVSNAAADEVQNVTITGAEGGTFTLSFDGLTTAPIASDDPDGSEVQAALEALPNIAAGDVQVGGGSIPGFSSYDISFKGALAKTDVTPLLADGSGLTDAPGATAAMAVETQKQGGADKIARFQPDNRANPTTYTADLGFTSPLKGSDATVGQVGNFAAALTVDPTNGDLLVADDGNKYVERFDSSGAFLSSFNGSSTPGGPFQSLLDIVVGGGVTYVLDATGPYDPGGGPIMTGISRVEKFDDAGGALGALPNDYGMIRARDLAYGASSASLLVVEQRIGAPNPSALHVYREDKEYQVLPFPDVDFAGIAGVAADNGSPSASGRIYATLAPSGQGGAAGIHVFDRLQLPDVTIGPATDITGTSMHLGGSVDPINGEASYYFKYCSNAGSKCAETPPKEASDGVEADITGLDANTAYEITLVATNGAGTHSSKVLTASTLPVAPTVVTGSASNRNATGAILHGTVNPNGSQSDYYFEYGPTAAYGSRSPAGFGVVVGKGQAPLAASQQIFGLQPATTYHYRLVAENVVGSEAGEDHTFTTSSVTEIPQRFYELVSPAEKGGNNVKAQIGFQASLDGSVFSFLGATVLGGLSESAPVLPRYVSRRSASAWSSKGTDPALIPGFNQPLKVTFGVSDDGMKAVGLSTKKLAPGAVKDQANIYLLDLTTGAYTTIASTPDLNWLQSETGPGSQAQMVPYGTPNFDHILLQVTPPLLPGAPENALYDFTGGQLRLASLSPEGTPIPGAVRSEHGMNALSRDGSRIAFASSSTGGVYLRSGGSTTAISESRRASDPPGTLPPAILIGGDRDLEHVYFFSKNLTDSSEPGIFSLYRYDVESATLELLTSVEKGEGLVTPFDPMQVSEDGSSVYFMAKAALTPGAPPSNSPKTYVWRDEKLSLVVAPETFLGPTRWWASPNGRYFAFFETWDFAGHDTTSPACEGKCAEVYRYDAETDDLICASCPPGDQAPIGSAYMGELYADVGTHSFLHAVNDRGQVFFGSPEQLVPQDTNSFSDVYEYSDDSGPRLISDGSGTGSQIAEVSASGNDVFFTTKDRLVGIDTDKATDVYDARVDGGLASQNPPPPREECIRDDCKAVPNGGPELPFGGSEALSGPGNVEEAPRKRCGKGRHARKVKGKQRCVKQKRNPKQSKTNNNRRQGR
jgi:hypothetical protein